MIIPNKYENLEKSLLVIGANIINILKNKPYNIEELFTKLKNYNQISLEQFYDTLLFLWLGEILQANAAGLSIKNQYVS